MRGSTFIFKTQIGFINVVCVKDITENSAK